MSDHTDIPTISNPMDIAVISDSMDILTITRPVGLSQYKNTIILSPERDMAT